jgi:hypothetical protein
MNVELLHIVDRPYTEPSFAFGEDLKEELGSSSSGH